MKILIGLIAIIAIVLLVAGAPLGLIWAINVLFHTGTAYTLTTWFAAFCLLLVASSHK